ncbi:MAG: hypothetical protein WA215_09540 [Candidatus Cybelea sp.]
MSVINRYAMGSCVAAAVLAGCGYPNASTAPAVNAASESLPHHKTFNYTGAKQSFVVPAGVTPEPTASAVVRGLPDTAVAAARKAAVDRHTSRRAHTLARLGKAGESTPPTASSSSTGSKPK